MRSPIKYYGSKSMLALQILPYFPKFYSVYVEAFGGAANLLFFKEPTPVEIYNDLGENVYALFKVLSDPKLFKQFKEKLDTHYYMEQVREEYKKDLLTELSLVDRAVRFFYVNRLSFNSVGGFSVNYKYIRRGVSKSITSFLSAIARLPEIHERLSRVIVMRQNAFDLIPRFSSDKAAFLYLDPPYVQSTRKSNTRYECELSDEDHARLLDLCLDAKAQIMISGYDSPIYDRLKGKFRCINLVDPNNKTAKECLWINYQPKNECTMKSLF